MPRRGRASPRRQCHHPGRHGRVRQRHQHRAPRRSRPRRSAPRRSASASRAPTPTRSATIRAPTAAPASWWRASRRCAPPRRWRRSDPGRAAELTGAAPTACRLAGDGGRDAGRQSRSARGDRPAGGERPGRRQPALGGVQRPGVPGGRPPGERRGPHPAERPRRRCRARDQPDAVPRPGRGRRGAGDRRRALRGSHASTTAAGSSPRRSATTTSRPAPTFRRPRSCSPTPTTASGRSARNR